jgi:hypothetical protein
MFLCNVMYSVLKISLWVFHLQATAQIFISQRELRNFLVSIWWTARSPYQNLVQYGGLPFSKAAYSANNLPSEMF